MTATSIVFHLLAELICSGRRDFLEIALGVDVLILGKLLQERIIWRIGLLLWHVGLVLLPGLAGDADLALLL